MNHSDLQSDLTVSVVIPFYKGTDWLSEAVESALSQDGIPCEIIVINDGSPEDVSAFLNRYGDRIIYEKKENGGPASARNRGIEIAKGDYIAFLDSDDLWKPDKLNIQIKKMLEYGANWSYTDYETFSENGPTEYKAMSPDQKEGFVTRFSPYIGTPTVVVSSAFLDENRLLFDEELRFGQDAFLWERLNSLAHALYLPVSLSKVRIRGKNAGKRAAVQIHARVEIYDKCVAAIPRYRERCSGVYRLAIALCRFGRLFVSKKRLNRPATEMIARVMFILPYLLFRLDRRLCASSKRQ